MALVGRIVTVWTLLAALALGWSAPATAQTADEYADEWTEARRGDRDWMQRATEQLTTGPVERMFGPPAEGAMKEIINRIITRVEGMYEQRRDPCLAAAVNMAHYQTLTVGRQEVIQGATEMLFSAAGGARGGGGIAEFLGKQLYDQVKEKLKEKAIDKFKKDMRDAMKRGLPVHFESDDSRGNCTTEFRIVWDKATERYDFLFAGDCQCEAVSCGKQGGTARLRRWTLTGWGAVIPEIEQLANGDKKVTWMIGQPRDVTLAADCCIEGDNRIRTDPRNHGGNEWVGLRPTPQTSEPPPRPQTGGTPPPTTGTGQTGTAGQPPRTTLPPRIDIPVIPEGPLTDAQLEELEQRVFNAEQLAQSEHRAAVTRVAELERSNAGAEEIAAAQAAEAAALETYRRARAAREALMDKVNQQQPQEQSSIVPPERLDRTSATILALHNKARAEVGSPPLQWDSQLAAGAAAYASQLTRLGRVHAPREGRKDIRENLLQSLRGGRSPEQMVGVWLAERQNFVPGIFPNVSRTGNWADVGHYTQMIWPTTTRLGCAIHSDARFDWTVCRYSPPGNRDGSPILMGPQPRGIVGQPRPPMPQPRGVIGQENPRPPVLANQDGIAPATSTTPTGPPPPPTARDPARDGDESKHPLVDYFDDAYIDHITDEGCCHKDGAENHLLKMRYALGELRKRLKAAKKAGPYSSVKPEDVQREIDAMERKLRHAESHRPGGTCPDCPIPLPPPPPPS